MKLRSVLGKAIRRIGANSIPDDGRARYHGPMAHPIRIYCPGPIPPSPRALMAFAAARGQALSLFEEFGEDDPASADWDAMGFVRRPGRPPIFVEVEWLDGPDARLVKAEIAEAGRALDGLPASPGREEARRRLRATRFVAGVAVSGEHVEEADWHVADALAACFEREAQGLAWIVGRGFFVDERPLGP